METSHTYTSFLHLKKMERESPDQRRSVGWVSFHRAKGGGFDSRSGHMPRLWAWARSGKVSLSHGCFSPSLSHCLPFSTKERGNRENRAKSKLSAQNQARPIQHMEKLFSFLPP